MDQMIEQIKLALDGVKTLSDAELQTIASYLVGQSPYEKVAPMMRRGKTSYYYRGSYRYTEEIGDACKQNPELLPRLGRHLRLMRKINEELDWRMIDSLLKRLSERQLFLDTGLGPQALLAWLFERGWGVKSNTPELLEMLYAQYPGELEAYGKNSATPDSLRPLAYFCGRRGEDILAGGAKKLGLLEKLLGKDEGTYSALLTREMLVAFGATVRVWGRGAEPAFYEALGRHLPEAAPMLKSPGIERAVEAESQRPKEGIRYKLAYALMLTGYKLSNVNSLARAACEADYHCFLTDHYWAVQRGMTHEVNLEAVNGYYNVDKEERTPSVLRQMNAMRESLEKMGVDPAYLCAWAVPRMLYSPELWTEPFDEMYGSDKAILKRAAGLSVRLGKAALLRRLHDLGEPLSDELPAACADTLRFHGKGHCKDEDVERVAQWLLTGEGPCDALPDLDAFYQSANRYRAVLPGYDPDFACWLLAGLHPMAGRYLDFVTSRLRHPRLAECLHFLLGYLHYTPEQVSAFIEENTSPVNAILCLASTSGIQEGNGSAEVKRIYYTLITDHPGDAVTAMAVKSAEAAARLAILDALYTVKPDYDPDFLIVCLGDKSKKVRQYAVSFLLPKKELIEKIRPLAEAKKKDVREAADQLLTAYEGGGIGGEEGDVLGLCTRLLPKSGMSAIRWAIPGDLPRVRWKDSDDKAEDIVVQCYLRLTAGAGSIDLHPAVARIREALNEDDLRAAACQIYSGWIADGAKTKNKGALLLYGIHATDADILALNRQIDDWANHSRGAIASEAVRAMAMNGGDLALMTVDNIGRKFKNKQVRRAGQEAFAAAAKALNTTPEALGDRIIPTLGFDERGEKVIDYGARSFTATLSPELTIQLQSEEGKSIKSLPKPGAKDDTEKAEKAKAEFTALKKSLKAVVTTQTQRLEQALATGRGWDTAAWKKLFVQNPIMHSFAIGLVWGVYKDGKLAETFRYMEDGSFTTVNEDEFDFDSIGAGVVGLVHPLDMDSGLLSGWKQQVEDYDIAQPVIQLERPVYRLEENERLAAAIDRFGGKKLLGITLMNKLQKSGWYRGSVQDAGCFYTFYREIEGIGMQVYFSGMYVSPDPGEVITMGQAGFYKAGAVERGSYVYDDVKKDEVIPLAEVPARMFSEVILDLTGATATSSETDEKWRKDSALLFFDGK